MNKPIYRKCGAILLIFTLLLFANTDRMVSAEAGTPFDDISDSYAQAQIIDLFNKNKITGTGYRTFEPDKPITRSEFVTLLNRVMNIEPVNAEIPAFQDVSKDAWFYGPVEAGLQLGLIDGTGPDRFEPQNFITRQEAAALLTRGLKQTVSEEGAVSLPFSDSDRVAAWAKPYVDSVNRLGLMSGDMNLFRPGDPITRQETAVVLDKLITAEQWAKPLSSNASPNLIQLGWQYNLTTAEYEQAVFTSGINTLSPRWFFLGKDSLFTDESDPSLIAWAKQHNKKIWAMVGNHSDKELTHQLLSQPDHGASAIKQLISYVQNRQFDGLNLDFENVDPKDRALLTSFIQDLAKEMHAVNAVLSVCVSPDMGTDWTEAFDYAAIGSSADYTVLMAYDEHWSGDETAGSVSSLPWFRSVLEHLIKVMPAQKIIEALPLYTQDWAVSNGITASAELNLEEQNRLIPSLGLNAVWNPGVSQYVVSFTQAGQQHQIWMEDSRSLAAKLQASLADHVAGVAYWYIGSESPDIWVSLNNVMKYDSYHF
ncbi:S-layer homology domain-containing protein [Paenibacillus filicis]|uniref:S-layer homology domain-containing protein n=1 Tax=Paenibacillus gyeongsangnamensis TaxID=3388067 RepID=A0ABT4Q4M0_9BACL|nr:S-layer homology domain-containing protein [Paenibacillus filicis]MCZ8511768.1 S-layer homology domain-containing protein [Paenibacillus filicis]